MVDAASHGRHDRFAIAAALGGGALPSTVGDCPSCGALHRDLLAIQIAIRHAWTPRRPRDLRLRRVDLAARRQALWRRLADTFGSSGDPATCPLALGLAALGIAGLALANVSIDIGGGVGAADTSAAVTPGIGDAALAPYLSTPVDGAASAHPSSDDWSDDPLVIVAGASLAAGGAILGLRRLASRRRAMR